MDNKLSEHGKPVAQIYYDEHDSSVMRIGWLRSDEPKNPETLYSQEYVSALDKVAQFWIGESAGWKQRAEDAEKRIAELEAIRSAAEKLVRCKGRYHSEQNYRALAALFGVTTPDLPPVEGDSEAVIAELRAKLATPVRLPGSFYPDGDIDLPLVVELDEAVEAIRAAGFKIEGED